MGTTCLPKPNKVKDYLRDQLLSYDNERATLECLDLKIVQLREAYFACRLTDKQTGDSQVFGGVILLTYYRGDSYDFCYKDMTEEMGPYYHNCPESILDLLTPTDNENANEWRRLCRERVAKRREAWALVETVRKEGRKRPWYAVTFPDIGRCETASINRARTWAEWAYRGDKVSRGPAYGGGW